MNTKFSTKVIVKLNRDTKEGRVTWHVSRDKPSSLSGTEVLLDNVYTTGVESKIIRLYKYQYKYWFDEGKFEWSEEYRLEFIDSYGSSEWTFPNDRAIYDLYDSVRYKTSNVEGFFDKYLSEEDKKDEAEDLF